MMTNTPEVSTEEPKAKAETATAEKPKEQEAKTLTQEQTNAIVAKERKEATAKAETALLAELGITDLDEAKANLKAYTQHKLDELSEVERLTAELETSKATAEKATTDAKLARYESDVKAKASTLEFIDPEDALKHVGEVEDFEDALAKLAEAKPYLIKQPEKNISAQSKGNPGTGRTQETREEQKKRLGM